MTAFDDMQIALADLESELMSFHIPEDPEMEHCLKHLIGAGGKRLRPGLAWICYGFGENPSLPVLPLMCMLELMHTASLIHDDIVDDAGIRRGVPAIQTVTDKRTATESGDYLLGLAMEYLKVYRGTGINEILADVSEQMCLGEISEMEARFLTEAANEMSCMEQIRRKTACLIAASCSCGAIAGGLDPAQREALRSYGEGIGTAFQLQDDLLDITADASFGKKRGQDLKKGIFTLPVVYAFLQQPDPDMIRLAGKQDKSDAETELLISYIKAAKGIEFTSERIRKVTREAVNSLRELPDGDHKRMLIGMAEALSQRTT